MGKYVNAMTAGIVVIGLICVGAIAFTHINPITTSSQAESPQSAGQPFTDRDLPLNLERTWIVSATEAKYLIDQGAILLDARANQWLGLNRLPGAQPVSWQEFSPKHTVQKGNLLSSDPVLVQKLEKLGIVKDRPVVVFADPHHGWGEDGRLVWMLRTLGHQQAVMVDGGYPALASIPLTSTAKRPTANFAIQRNANWQIQREELKAALTNPKWTIIDTRTPKEYGGSTPHGEKRKGHVPGAVNLHFRSLLNQQGKLLPREQILTRLQVLGITKDTPIVAYCTGGIRSGWLTVVLADMGFQIKNYAGSMWEWSAGPSQVYPLTVKPS